MQIRDSKIDPKWIEENMRLNPPSVMENGNLFSGPVRLAFVNLLKPGKPNDQGKSNYSTSLLFPPGTDLRVFQEAWFKMAREKFPQNFDANGQPVGLHSPFHDQAEKAIGSKPYAGYTPGAIYFDSGSQYKPPVVDLQQNPITDENRVYPGVWAFVVVNPYSYKNKKTGVGFGLQGVMIAADDARLGGGGIDPKQAFGHVKITATSNVAAKFAGVPMGQGAGPQGAASIMPGGGHVGAQGNLPVQGLPASGGINPADL